tara:strand:+ start:2150 stop:3277 length:1128 start_codon:yes stop_codon:yes gene_type:complete
MNFFLKLILFLIICFPVLAIDTKVTEAIVLDYNTNEIIFEKNPSKKINPASMTKILTSYILFDRIKNTNMSLNDKCTISSKAYRMGGSRMFLEINTKVSINDLLRGIIIQSGNDASVAIAECLSGTEENFSSLMNSFAKKIGLQNSNFTNSSGWPEENHYSTVKDLSILTKAIINDFPEFYSFFMEKSFTYNGIRQPNRNKLLTEVDGADGLKTGFTKASGWGIAASAIRENRRIIIVINGANSSRSRLIESEKLINWAFRETSQQKILNKGQVIKEVDVWLGSKPTANLVIEKDIITTLSYEQLKTIKSSIEYNKPISAPINKGDIIGQMTIKIKGKQNMQIPLIADKNIKNINPLFRVFAAIKYLIFGTSLNE